jgi:hypothetical protein
MRPISRTKRCLFVALLVLVPYLVIETVASTWAWCSWWDQSFGMTEDIHDTFVFDPVRGFRLTRTPARTARITNGHIEYVGAFRGNNQGFPDRDDFGPSRPAGGGLRLAVLGDSFSHAHYLSENWPDHAEDLTRERGEPVQLLNLSLSYVGLANWWSILTKVVDAEDYDIDGVIFAVWETNLLRSFTTCSTPEAGPERSTFLFGRCRTWDPATWPKTAEEARRFRDENMRQYLLPREEFERVLQGKWPAPAPRHFRPIILTGIWRFVRGLVRHTSEVPAGETPGAFEPGRARMVEDMRRYLARRGIPALVIHIPSRETILAPDASSRLHFEKSQEFAKELGATFLDGGQAFAGLNAREIRALFYPHDGHWNQAGSDRFAEFVVGHLESFRTRKPPLANAAKPR